MHRPQLRGELVDRDREILDEKARLRLRLRQARRALSRALVRQASDAVVGILRAWLMPKGELAVYAGVDGELEVDGAASGPALYPRIQSKIPPLLAFHRVDGRAALRPARFGVLEPAEGAPRVPLSDAAAVIVPGLGFDRQGHRLGQGGGYYDAALRQAPSVPRIGVAHSFQLLPHIPVDDHDQTLDFIVTPDGAFPTGARPHIHSPGGSL